MSEPPETILNLDDTEAIRYAKSRTLRRAGFTVLEAGTGAEALARMAEARPVLALLDVKLLSFAEN
jgi:CheY-like chemotaxis protein